jgi:hypothetical protein
MKHRHYQPSVPVLVWRGTATGLRETDGGFFPFETMVKRANVAVICERGGELGSRIEGASIPQRLIRRYANLDEYARMLYFWFYELDREQPEAIIAQMPAREGIGIAIEDRLSRAASGEVAPER